MKAIVTKVPNTAQATTKTLQCRIDSGIVGGEADRARITKFVPNRNIAVAQAQLPLHLDGPLIEMNGWHRPDIVLSRSLEIHLVLEFSDGFLRKNSILNTEIADSGLICSFHCCALSTVN
jgi:hypothetical protein